MIAALGMLKALHKQTEAEVTRLRQQLTVMATALKLLQAKRTTAAKVTSGHISAKGRARIVAAQKARWAAYHKQQAQLVRKEKV